MWVGGGEECWRSPTAPALGGFLSAAEFQKLLCWGGGDHGDTELLLTQPPCQHQSHRSVSRSGSGGVEQQETCCSSGRVNQETGGRLLSNKRCWERDLTLPSISDLTQPSISATKRTKQSKPNEREGVILSTGDCGEQKFPRRHFPEVPSTSTSSGAIVIKTVTPESDQRAISNPPGYPIITTWVGHMCGDGVIVSSPPVKMCEYCKLKPCITEVHGDELCELSAECHVLHSDPATVTHKKLEALIRRLLVKYFGLEYVKDLGCIPLCAENTCRRLAEPKESASEQYRWITQLRRTWL